ncbi:MAG: DUF2892 domain-containing protein [Bacteroidetes bacterium]|nr:DUF2892 domain-containing protein [Bacteroidota bacterium]MCW5895275.1 DUF2892 domain-containing protein [Bacteroidota bacterium]
MQKNMGTTDRILRVVAALILGFLLLNGTISGTLGVVLGILAIILLATSAIGFCPLYMPFKLSTTTKSK